MKNNVLTLKEVEKFESEFMRGLPLQSIANMNIECDKNGNYFDPHTKFVVNYKDPCAPVIGRLENGKVEQLNFDDVLICASLEYIIEESSISLELKEKILQNKKIKKYLK